MHASRHGNRGAERKEPTPELTTSPRMRPAPQHWTLYEQLAHARTQAEHSIEPYSDTAYVDRMLQDWTKYETEILDGHTGPPDTTPRTTWDSVRSPFEDSSRPDQRCGDDYDAAITNCILAYHSWSIQQSIQLHSPHDDPGEWHPVGPTALEVYLHENTTTGAHSITSLRLTAPQPIPEPHIPPRPNETPHPPRRTTPLKEDKAGVCAICPAAAGLCRPAHVLQAGCGRVSLCVHCPGCTDGTLL